MAEIQRITQEIVHALEAGMQEQGIGWDELQTRTGVTWATVRHWKLGTAVPKVETAMVALDAVGYELRVVRKDVGRLYTEGEVEAVMRGACEDGRQGYDPYDCLIRDYID